MTRRRLFVALVVVHALVLLGWGATLERARARAAHVLLEVLPVDPRDLVRGDYITLGYAIAGLTDTPFVGRRPDWNDVGYPVYVALASKGDVHVVVAASLERSALPLDGGRRLIVGRLMYAPQLGRASGAPLRVQYGVERYYVPEGKGILPPGLRDAEVLLTDEGRAYLVRLFINGRPYP